MALLALQISCGDSHKLELSYVDNKTPSEFEQKIASYPYRDEELKGRILSRIGDVRLGQSSNQIISLMGAPTIHFMALSGSDEGYKTEVLIYVASKAMKEASDDSEIVAFHIDSVGGLFWVDVNGKDFGAFSLGRRDLRRGMYIQYR